MNSVLRTMMAAGVGLMAVAAPVASYADTSLGIYQTPDRLEDYEVTLCGKDSKALCAKLVALHGSADAERGRKYLNTMMLNQAKPVGKNKWQGTITLEDHSFFGSILLRADNTIETHACAYVVICASLILSPAIAPTK